MHIGSSRSYGYRAFLLLAGDKLIDATHRSTFRSHMQVQDAKNALVKAVIRYALSLHLLPMSNTESVAVQGYLTVNALPI